MRLFHAHSSLSPYSSLSLSLYLSLSLSLSLSFSYSLYLTLSLYLLLSRSVCTRESIRGHACAWVSVVWFRWNANSRAGKWVVEEGRGGGGLRWTVRSALDGIIFRCAYIIEHSSLSVFHIHGQCIEVNASAITYAVAYSMERIEPEAESSKPGDFERGFDIHIHATGTNSNA